MKLERYEEIRTSELYDIAEKILTKMEKEIKREIKQLEKIYESLNRDKFRIYRLRVIMPEE